MDLDHLENSPSYLEAQLDSLADTVLQNQRGLDLLFMRPEGLCRVLKETCCFYVNQSRVIREN